MLEALGCRLFEVARGRGDLEACGGEELLAWGQKVDFLGEKIALEGELDRGVDAPVLLLNNDMIGPEVVPLLPEEPVEAVDDLVTRVGIRTRFTAVESIADVGTFEG